MKSYIAAAAVFAAGASAQSIADIPTCALTCLATDIPQVGCSITDFTCACTASSQLVPLAEPCIQSACSADDQEETLDVLEAICSSVGVPITISTPAPSSSVAASSAAVSTPASSAAVSTPAVTSSAVASSVAVSLPGSSSVCTISTATATVTAVGTGSASPTGSNGTVTTAAPSAFTGAATANGVTFGAAGLLGLLAYLL